MYAYLSVMLRSILANREEVHVITLPLNLGPMTLVAIDEITSVHPDILAIWDSIGGDLPTEVQPRIEAQAILDHLSLFPITLHKCRNKTYCLTGICSYQVACRQLPNSMKIPVRYYEGRRGNQFDRLLITELATCPLIYRKPHSVVGWLFKVCSYFKDRDSKYSILKCDLNKSAFAKSIGADVRGIH